MRLSFRHHSWLFVLVTFAVVAVPFGFAIASFLSYRSTVHATVRAEELSGRIRYLDEVLTMSARMAATTGEARWSDRYNEHVAELDSVIQDFAALANSRSLPNIATATATANAALVDMENRALALAQLGRSSEAYALLTSPRYEEQKQIYGDGLNLAVSTVRATFAGEIEQRRAFLRLMVMLAAAGFLTCFTAWSRLANRFLRNQDSLNNMLRAERDAANAANNAKSLFLAAMSHELRTPLNAVIGYSEMMRETAMEQDRPDDASDHTNVIDAARRQLALVNDLLDLAKAEAGKVSLQIETFDVRAMIEEVVATIAPAAAARGNAVLLELDPGLTTAHSDEFRLGQCLLNLLSNAVKFTENGQIVLRAHRDRAADCLVFAVQDNGIGISPAQMQKLFQPFVQASAGIARTHGGTGLGLSITRHLARFLGGDITVESRLGQGSTFTLRVPVAMPDEETNLEGRALQAA